MWAESNFIVQRNHNTFALNYCIVCVQNHHPHSPPPSPILTFLNGLYHTYSPPPPPLRLLRTYLVQRCPKELILRQPQTVLRIPNRYLLLQKWYTNPEKHIIEMSRDQGFKNFETETETETGTKKFSRRDRDRD